MKNVLDVSINHSSVLEGMNQYCFIIGNPALSGRSYNKWSLLRDLDFLEISLADFLGDGWTTVVGFRVNYLEKNQ